MELKSHNTMLEGLLPKSGEYPVALREAKSILVEEQKNLIPIYMDGMHVSFLEAKVMDAERLGSDADVAIEQVNASFEIDTFRGNMRNLVYGMKEYGSHGYPELMVLTDDLNSSDSAITKPKNPQFSFEIKPKNFKLGLTGRLLEDGKGQKYNEHLFIGLDIYDAFDFAREISPERIVALTNDGREIVVYENHTVIGETEELNSPIKKRHYLMSEDQLDHWMSDDTEVLPTGGLSVVFSDFYEKIKGYERGTMMFGHKYKSIDEFLGVATLFDEHIIWKICKSERGDPNTPLIDAGPHYGLYMGQPRYENINRLHFMPGKAHLWFYSSWISFDKPTGIKAMMDLGDIVRDLWIDPFVPERDGWDIVLDKSRGITPEKPVKVENQIDYQKYPVLKE